MARQQQTQWIGRPAGQAHVFDEQALPHTPTPVLRGYLLSILAEVVRNVPFLQSAVYTSAGFGVLRNNTKLQHVHPRLDPTVISVDSSVKSDQVAAFRELLAEDWSGRRASKPFTSILDYHEAYKAGTLSPVDVAEALLPLVRRDVLHPANHSTAFLQTRVDLVRKVAAESAARYKAGKPLSPLDGVPVAVKDEVDLAGYKRCLASKVDFTNPADVTTVCAQKWEDAGAVIVGKLNMHELGMDTTTLNPVHGTPLNPYNDQYFCGGSSGGSGYVLAAGIVPVSHGADGGGSIRIPASFCGTYGLKPSHNRISGRPTPSLATSVGVHGPMAANMVDLEISYRLMAQPDSLDTTAALFTPPKSTASIEKRAKVIGIDRAWLKTSDPPVREAFDKAVDWLTRKRGYQIVDIKMPLLYEGQLSHAISISCEIAAGLPDLSNFTAPNKILLSSIGGQPTAIDLLQAQKARTVLMEHLASLYNEHQDLVILTPTTPCAGWQMHPGDLAYGCTNGNMSIKSMAYVYVANFTGVPALTTPMGYAPTSNGGIIPMGLMGMGDWCSEDKLLAFGYDMEDYMHNELQGGRQRPQNWVDVIGLAKKQSS